jgi:RHS repeat-associated protein
MTTSGARTEYSLPAGSWPTGITTGPDGNLWFTDQGSSKVGKITTVGVVTEYAQPAESYPGPIAKGSDNNLWFTEWKRNKIVKITTAGTVTEYAVPAGSTPVGIAAGPDGNLWFTNEGTSKIGKITTSGTVTEYSLPAGTYPDEITAGPDGNLWFSSGEKIWKITTAGGWTEYALPESSGASGIAAGVDKNVWFTDSGPKKVGKITATGTITEYSVAGIEPHAITSGPDGNIWYVEGTKIGMMPTLGAITEPTEALAPVPAGVSCSPELKRGCRALTFNYASSTTATGEASSEWGDYSGHLTRVYYTAYDPVSKTMKTVEVAHYLYDKQARLRAEWDPRVSPALKTTYGYDTEGHLTALTAAGQESWGLTYGTSTTDSSPGRLLKALQAPASASLWGGGTVKNTSVPVLSGSTVVGVRMAVTKGVWSGSPIAYGYTWEDCNTSGGECTPIPGASNPNYTPVSKDVGHKLVAVVAATNGDGSVTAASMASAAVTATGGSSPGEAHSPQPGSTVEYNVALSGSGLPNLTKAEVEKWAQKDFPTEATAVFPPDEPQSWPAGDYKRATIYYRDSTSRTVNIASPGGAIATSEYNEHNDVARSLSADNREASLKEGAKSAEIAQKLDTQSTYNSEGTELLSTLGPRHLVKLQNGSEVQARSHTVYSYDEGAPSEGGPYRLVTRTTQGAQVEGEGEQDLRTTITSYSAQNGLGWKLRRPTSVATDPAGLDLVHTTVYDEATGNVVETKAPGGSVESVYPPVFSSSLGTEGSGSGQFNHPEDTAIDLSGNLWVDDKNNHRLQKFSPAGTLLGTYGSEGSGEGQFKEVWGIAVDKTTGNIIVSDAGNNRIDVFTPTGTFVRMFGSTGSGNGQLKEPDGLTVESHGNVWVADLGNSRIEEFSSTGTYLSQFGSKGTGDGQFIEPTGVEVSEGQLYVTDLGNDRVEEFTPTGTFVTKFGSEGAGQGQLKGPEGITVNAANGDLYVSDPGNQRIEEFSPNGKYLAMFGAYGAGPGQFHGPTGLTVGPTGVIYIADQYNARVDEWIPPEAGGARMLYSTSFGSEGSGEGQFSQPAGTAIDGSGNLWVSDYNNGRIEKFSPAGKFVASYGTKGSGNGQFVHPTGIAVNQSTGNVYVGDCGNSRIEELNSTGGFVRAFGSAGTEPGKLSCMDGVTIDPSGNVWVADTHNNRVQEFSATGTFIAAYGSYGTGNGQFSEPADLTFSGGNMYIVDTSNDRVQELSMTGTYIKQFGFRGSDSGELKSPEAIVTDAAGNLYVLDNENGRVEEFKPSGTYLATFASPGNGEGQLSNPLAMAISAAGDIYIADSAHNHIQIWTPADQAVHDTQTIYYTTAANAKYPACGEHAEWANLPCQTQPAEQPNTPSAPNLPINTVTYNMYGQPTKTTSTVGTDTRVATVSYDQAGRALTTELTSTVGKALPSVSMRYDEATGLPVEQSTVVEGKTQSVISAFNTLGQLTSYTDADGNINKYEYETEKDARLVHVDDGKGTKEYTYDETTGLLKKTVDTQGTNVLTFTATYDPEGNPISEAYPNGMSANYTLNQTGETTAVNYVKTTHCTENCTWLSDSAIPSIHGQWMSQQSTLATQNYVYDQAGRLTQVQETPATEGCTTHIYGYDEETNRTSLTTRPPGVGGTCATEGGTTEAHSYDSANRLTDTGVIYDSFGDTTKLPATDAGGSELQSSFYSDGQLEGQTQNGQTLAYQLDPTGRTRQTVDTGTVNSTTINHYTGPGDSPTWTIEPVSGHWSRNVSGINGLGAIETDTKEPTLQLSDLQGNIIATASTSETATKLLGSERPTEYGVPTTTKPAKYSWLGSDLRATELSSGVIAMGARSYIPQLGRFLQTDPIPGGSANAYTYVFGDPINSNDPSGEYSSGPSSWALELATQITGEEVAAYEAALRAEAERKAAEAAAAAAAQDPTTPTEGAPEPLGGYEDWACQYAAQTGQEAEGCSGGSDLMALTDPQAGTDKNESECNKNGQKCSQGKCRSGGKMVKGKCHKGPGDVPNDCGLVGGALGGAIGSIGGVYGGVAGGWAGSQIGEQLCGKGKT